MTAAARWTRTLRTTRLRLLGASVAAVLAATTGCGAPAVRASVQRPGSAAGPGSGSAPATTSQMSGTTMSTHAGRQLGQAEVTCYLADRQHGGLIANDIGRVRTACTSLHNQEAFTLAGTGDLDDCYRSVAASSDVVITRDSLDPGKLQFSDPRITGHNFATAGGPGAPPAGLACSIDLHDDTTVALLSGTAASAGPPL